MNIITLDFETYFDDEYTIKKMTTEEYIRDPRFTVLGVGIRWNHVSKVWYDRGQWEALIKEHDFSGDAILCHHSQFDAFILNHHYGIRPALHLDTLSMARLLLGNHVSASLDSVSKHFGLPAKSVPYNLFKGKHWHELTPAVQQMVADGCLHDVELTWQIFREFMQEFPREEIPVVDMTIRMFTEPCLVGDVELLGQVWTRENQKKHALMAALNATPEDLQSADKFATLLRAEGIEPETKEGKNGAIFAFAKSDDFMKELLEHDNDRVRTLAACRLGVKSTGDQARAERLGWMARRGPLTVYLKYAGAHTTRWAGGDATNFQNFRRGGDIRKALCAPPGWKLAIVDASQIECRILNYIAGQWDVIDKFARGEDPYIGIASGAYGREVTKEDKAERGTGKQLELSCGFGAGAKTIVNTAKLGIYGPPVFIDEAKGLEWRDLYRSTHPQVVNYWRDAEMCLKRMANWLSYDWGCLRIQCDVNTGRRRIVLPNGTQLIYDTLEWHVNQETGESGWRIKNRRGWDRMYGGKLTENIVQALARVVKSQAMLRIRALGFMPRLLVHDEIVVLVASGQNEENDYNNIVAELQRTPAWLPGIPLDAKGGLSDRYNK